MWVALARTNPDSGLDELGAKGDPIDHFGGRAVAQISSDNETVIGFQAPAKMTRVCYIPESESGPPNSPARPLPPGRPDDIRIEIGIVLPVASVL